MKTDLQSQVSAIIRHVRRDGDRALIHYTSKFDGVRLSPAEILLSTEDIRGAKRRVGPAVRRAVDTAAANIRAFHREEARRLGRRWRIRKNGVVTGQDYSPVRRVGVYVPGGRFSYPSTVLMTVIPARAAGVEHVTIVTPPGRLGDELVYAAAVSGADEIARVGGPAAVAALAYGTGTIQPVDMIVGPGNAYVNEAKRQVFGQVGIDSLAGPSEVVIFADKSADPAWVLEDLLAQCEHDPNARAYLLSDAPALLKRVRRDLPAAVADQVEYIPCSREEAPAVIDRLAPEHLELLAEAPDGIARRVRNAGAVFAGRHTPTALGDYWAGPSHVLPTGRTARFSSGLSVMTFLKKTSYIRYSGPAVRACADDVKLLADTEGLTHHGRSVGIRKNGGAS